MFGLTIKTVLTRVVHPFLAEPPGRPLVGLGEIRIRGPTLCRLRGAEKATRSFRGPCQSVPHHLQNNITTTATPNNHLGMYYQEEKK